VTTPRAVATDWSLVRDESLPVHVVTCLTCNQASPYSPIFDEPEAWAAVVEDLWWVSGRRRRRAPEPYDLDAHAMYEVKRPHSVQQRLAQARTRRRRAGGRTTTKQAATP
jgi:hypothetical protein